MPPSSNGSSSSSRGSASSSSSSSWGLPSIGPCTFVLVVVVVAFGSALLGGYVVQQQHMLAASIKAEDVQEQSQQQAQAQAQTQQRWRPQGVDSGLAVSGTQQRPGQEGTHSQPPAAAEAGMHLRDSDRFQDPSGGGTDHSSHAASNDDDDTDDFDDDDQETLQDQEREPLATHTRPELQHQQQQGKGSGGGWSQTMLPNLLAPANITDQGLYPRLIGIGCQKCGTTSLAAYLSMVKGFIMSTQKEIHAFNGDLLYRQYVNDSPKLAPRLVSRVKWYGSKWGKLGLNIKCDAKTLACHGNAKPDTVPFEFTPRYMSDLRRPYNMWQMLPGPEQTTFVAILRDPVARAWSSYHHALRPEDATPQDFGGLISEEVRLLRSCYNSTLALLSLDGLQRAHTAYQGASAAAKNGGSRGGHSGGGDTSANKGKSNKEASGTATKAAMGMEAGGPFDLAQCRDIRAAYDAFHQCMKPKAADAKQPWFVKFTLNYDADMNKPAHAVNRHAGFAYMGLYADQLFNFLCAGFKPDQFIILTSGELKAEPVAAVKRVTDAFGRPFDVEDMRWFERGLSNNRRSRGRMPARTEALLRGLFQPYNLALARLLASMPFNVNMTHVLDEFGVNEADIHLAL
ncbi:hypothetical protein PTSG_07029 [Salpingoeca rosetta]|uniref:Sulfotransferase domain-containing protein n=1 Tax=Salpingoeca rosetta (strain ATCC 50818 / BSB-021) TaxID=946362 RepID=F2UDU6_SALR5|nr:uncharacterized protein PTSG_07029 [Salpingoeca rosetta]EGD74796.1 hypothetical protein PTSG_07029 [Salpingoeca rosetta]|eukprot:XP_004992441.1 hypothetical protein PTSG_07029 [Salpingoeca rosetta]